MSQQNAVFQKKFINTFEELKKIPVRERWQYYLARSLLSQKKGFILQNEALVTRKEIEAGGVLCQPFWEDSTLNIDSEGRAFSRYRSLHKDFDIMLRKTAFEKLLRANELLPNHIKIVLKASLRPISVQQEVFDEEFKNAKIKFPDKSYDEIYNYTLQFVTDPKVNIPPHATGGAIDIVLYDTKAKSYLDMGNPVNSIDDLSWTSNFIGLTDAQISNRKLITTTMLEAGFASLASEWWHYSYGDQRWAVYYDQSQASYGAANV
ncbi:hypothetical protein DYH10_02745 [Candidatus Saccharibacteria bacterium CPR2]|nr:hypothetical protein [Candidatus Saccharibacteria bacterium CPR2]